MKNYAKLTPEGTRDYLFEESDARRTVERRLSDLFKAHGYRRIITPTFEFFDVFNRESAGALPEAMYSMTDAYGRLLVLRSDSTLPIARVAATRLQGASLPIRLYYNQNVFTRQPRLSGHSDECAQSGVELIGASGLRADLEILTMAVQALETCGAPDSKIEIGHAGYFKALCAALECSEEITEEIYNCMESKNYVALGNILDGFEQTPITNALRNLPRMFGGTEVLEKATAVTESAQAGEALSYLRTIYERLEKAGLSENIIIDLSLVHRSNYYTGLVFRGYTAGSGVTVLLGGRYDSLIREFGSDLPATGFGLHIDDLARAMLSRGEVREKTAAQVLVFGEDGCETEALRQQSRMTAAGTACEHSVCADLESAKQYAKQNGIPRVLVIGKAGAKEIEL